MSGKSEENKELIKSLAESLNITEDEAITMINSDLSKAEEKKTDDEEDEYSEEMEKSLEKAANESKMAYDNYIAKKSKKEVAKSEESNIGGTNEEDMMKSFGDMFENLSSNLMKSVEDRFEGFEKSLAGVEDMREEMSVMKSEIEKIGNFTPPAKTLGLSTEHMIEKSINGGIESNGKTHLSAKVHKEKIGELLGELYDETTGDMQKSIEVDMSNFVSGSGSITGKLGEVATRLLAEKKNVVVI